MERSDGGLVCGGLDAESAPISEMRKEEENLLPAALEIVYRAGMQKAPKTDLDRRSPLPDQ